MAQLVKRWPVKAPALHKGKPKHGGLCLDPQAGRSEVQGHSQPAWPTPAILAPVGRPEAQNYP